MNYPVFWDIVKCRIAKEGLILTIWYFFVTIFLGRLGIEFNNLYRAELPCDSVCIESVKIFYTLNDIPTPLHSMLDKLMGSNGFVSRNMEDDKVLAVGFESDQPVSWCWLTRIKNQHSFLEPGDWLIHSCATLPAVKGQGFYPRSIRSLVQVATNQWLSGNGGKFLYIECSIANNSSIKGIKKAGLEKKALLIKFWGRMFLRWKFI
ncbi:hypothetical protein [uncultured Desulfobulbus sp.]|uniref:hypothetical protein n=1 Tax=uncultured Desulfobulbus sp. TaxID=239745 RepID=UPI0029C80635|nr:hypothetical protein [uncultured Desulfobulbus sp.]